MKTYRKLGMITLLVVLVVFSCITALCSEKPMIIRFGHIQTTTHPEQIGAVKMAEVIKRLSNGRMQMDVFPLSQLGGSRDLMVGVQTGTVEIVSTSTFGMVEPKMMLMEMPYLFRDREHVRKTLDSSVAKDLLGLLDAQGVKGLGFWEVGFRHITNNKRPINTPNDMKGLVIRAFEHQILKDTLAALGASAIVLPFPEVYMACQTGTIDGQENPFMNIAEFRLYEVQKYITLTQHMHNFEVIAANKKWWNSLSAANQRIILKAYEEGTKAHRRSIEELDKKYKQVLIDNGMKFVSNPDYKAFEKAVQPVYDKWEAKYGSEITNAIRGIK